MPFLLSKCRNYYNNSYSRFANRFVLNFRYLHRNSANRFYKKEQYTDPAQRHNSQLRRTNAYDKSFKAKSSAFIDEYSDVPEDENEILSMGESDFTDADVTPERQQCRLKSSAKQREFLKMKIIERKYFKPERPKNILSWAAKQQMRYLNNECPEEWTIERLSESFQVDRESVIAIMKSSYVPVDIEQHDRKAARNILMLGESERLKLGFDKPNRVGGIQDLRIPPTPRGYIKERKPGVFESIYLSYHEAVKKIERENKEPQKNNLLTPGRDNGFPVVRSASASHGKMVKQHDQNVKALSNERTNVKSRNHHRHQYKTYCDSYPQDRVEEKENLGDNLLKRSSSSRYARRKQLSSCFETSGRDNGYANAGPLDFNDETRSIKRNDNNRPRLMGKLQSKRLLYRPPSDRIEDIETEITDGNLEFYQMVGTGKLPNN